MVRASSTAAPLASSSGSSQDTTPNEEVREDDPVSGSDEPEAQASKSSDARAEKIRRAAYAAYERRGGAHGHEVEDWIRAEAEVDRETVIPNPPPRSV